MWDDWDPQKDGLSEYENNLVLKYTGIFDSLSSKEEDAISRNMTESFRDVRSKCLNQFKAKQGFMDAQQKLKKHRLSKDQVIHMYVVSQHPRSDIQ